MRIAVTGGTGFLGSFVTAALTGDGHDVEICARATGVDLRDADAAAAFFAKANPELIVHCAAHVGGIGYVAQHAVEVFEDNVNIAMGLLAGMRAAGAGRLITIMPNCTYPGHQEIYREAGWWDGAIHDSVLMYGLPRKMLWGLCQTYGNACGFESAHLILPNLYGPKDHFDPLRSHALGALVCKIVDAKRTDAAEVCIWGSGRPIREWMYVRDAASAIACYVGRVAGANGFPGDHPIFNVGNATGVSIAALAEMIREVVGWDGRFVFDRDRADGAMQKLLDGTRFIEQTGWHASTPLREGIRETVQWYEANCLRELDHAH
ncbi:MAG: NAD-dependent epimerase/dehydratase family protein [Phycisphaerae bacterium]